MNSGFEHAGRRQWFARTVSVLPAPVRLILTSIIGFNIGFYLIVPFLAVHLAADLGLTASVIGTVLGLRMLAQQGLFFLGGALAERLGYRRMALTGIAVRVSGFGVLAVADSVAAVIAGVLLIGVAAALFAPAVEGANAVYGRRLEDAGLLPRADRAARATMSRSAAARAGNTPPRRCASTTGWAQPRACGEHTCLPVCLHANVPVFIHFQARMSALSPRTDQFRVWRPHISLWAGIARRC